jgi:hypothetical protein
MTLFAILHPIVSLKAALRRWIIKRDASAALLEGHPKLPPELAAFQVGEILPWKGQQLRVARIGVDPIPAIVLVPVALTRGAKLRVLRDLRDRGREALSDQRQTARQLKRAVR